MISEFRLKSKQTDPKSRRNLLSLKDIRYNGDHIETNNKVSEEFLILLQ